MKWQIPKRSLLLAACVAFLSGTALADAESIERGKSLAATCAACHQADGNGMDNANAEPWPRIAGLNKAYLVKQLNDFKSGKRQNASMQPFANMLASDQQVEDVAAYFASLPASIKPSASQEKALLERGQKLAERGDWDNYIVPCSTCHGPDNQGVGEHFPQLAGQHAAYIEKQLTSWQAGERKNDPQALMSTIAERLSSQDIKAVAAWFAHQKAQ